MTQLPLKVFLVHVLNQMATQELLRTQLQECLGQEAADNSLILRVIQYFNCVQLKQQKEETEQIILTVWTIIL